MPHGIHSPAPSSRTIAAQSLAADARIEGPGARRNSAPLPRTNPLDGNPLPAHAPQARQQNRFEIQSNTNWLKRTGLAVAVPFYAVGKFGLKLLALPFKAIDAVFCNLPSRGIHAGMNWARGLERTDRSNFPVQVPGMPPGRDFVSLDGSMLPKLTPKGTGTAALQQQVQRKINAGHDLLEAVRNGTHTQPATKADISNIAFYLQARGQLQNNGESFDAGSFNIPDPGGRIRQFLDSAPEAYQRSSSHLNGFQALAGGRHRGIDLTKGGGPSLDEAMPYGKETLLYGSLPQNDDLQMPEDRLFLKMETHGAWLSKPGSGYETASPGPRRTGQWHDVGAFVDHSCSYILSRGQGSAAGSRKERIPDDLQSAFRRLTSSVDTETARLLNANDPLNKSKGVRVMYRNAIEALNTDLPAPHRKAIQEFVTTIQQKYPTGDLLVRVGNEIVF